MRRPRPRFFTDDGLAWIAAVVAIVAFAAFLNWS